MPIYAQGRILRAGVNFPVLCVVPSNDYFAPGLPGGISIVGAIFDVRHRRDER